MYFIQHHTSLNKGMASWVVCISLIIINIIGNIWSHCSCRQRVLKQSRQVWMDFSPKRNWDLTETVTDVTKWLVTWEEVPVSPRSSWTGHRLAVTARNTKIPLILLSERSKHYCTATHFTGRSSPRLRTSHMSHDMCYDQCWVQCVS